MEPGEPSFELSAIKIEENAEEQVVPVLLDPLAEGYVVEMSGPLDENIADNRSQCLVGCSLNEKREIKNLVVVKFGQRFLYNAASSKMPMVNGC
ncbi:unnamed protein product [Allacma fusca]|uniref:Uncharacterized protein n=1 Tax=Allacma fusca TaxID=39272 RepID=A0A8J2J881_9HEXA|nr:unnamed protein product [Allacma fusca]